jgi:hypothetical protein
MAPQRTVLITDVASPRAVTPMVIGRGATRRAVSSTLRPAPPWSASWCSSVSLATSLRVPYLQRVASLLPRSAASVRTLYSERSECDDQPQQSGYVKGLALILGPISGGFVLNTC